MSWSLADLNWLAILVATLAAFMLGGVWYGPLFGNAWLAAMGKQASDIKPSARPFIISFLTALVTSIAMAVLLRDLGIDRLVDGVLFGLLVGVAFIAASMASDFAFCGWSTALLLIQAGYRIAYSVIMGAILAVWR